MSFLVCFVTRRPEEEKDELDDHVKYFNRLVHEVWHNMPGEFDMMEAYDDNVGMKENAGRARRLGEGGYERVGARISRIMKDHYDSEDAYLEDRRVAEAIVESWFRQRSCRGVGIPPEPRNKRGMQSLLGAVGARYAWDDVYREALRDLETADRDYFARWRNADALLDGGLDRVKKAAFAVDYASVCLREIQILLDPGPRSGFVDNGSWACRVRSGYSGHRAHFIDTGIVSPSAVPQISVLDASSSTKIA